MFNPFGFGWWGYADDSIFLALLFGIVGIAIIVWTIAWKGLALWRASRKGQKEWFILLLIVNTFGILEILYLYIFSKQDKDHFGEFVQKILAKFKEKDAVPTEPKEIHTLPLDTKEK